MSDVSTFFDWFPVVEQARQNNSQSLADAVGSSAVGRELHDAREALGLTVGEVATTLRIRAVYIDALEEGRFSDLPGRPYALGFARSLATHLGLDPDAIALRLRDELMGTAPTVELVFPESTEDKRLSRAGWIAISLVLIAAAYGGWVALSNRHRDTTPPEFASTSAPPKSTPVTASEPAASDDAVEAVEDKTPETTVGAPPPPTVMVAPAPAPAAPAAVVPPPADTAKPVPPTPAPVANASQPVPASKLEETKPPVVAAPKPSPAPAAVAPAKPTPPLTPVAPAKPAPAASAPSSDASVNSADDEEDSTPEPTAVAGTTAVPPLAKPAPAPAAAPAAVPAQTTPSRILLRAHQDSWIQIQSADGVTVMARTLKSGDSYPVPDRAGLRLTTGNAGALDVIVDGQAAPSLGQAGIVRRNVALDPARLKAGTALE
jgi:cytoskeleton protein RodZ